MVASVSIIIPVYNRSDSLQRLLRSLERSDILEEGSAQVIFSLEKGVANEVRKVVEEWDMDNLGKRIDQNEGHLGVDAHLLKCGGYSQSEGPVIILEDDSLVGPYLMKYVHHVLQHLKTKNTSKIGGISLYQYQRTYEQWPFTPMVANEAFYLQKVSTRGQLFTPEQWQVFEEWRQSNPDLRKIDHKAPPQIQQYPDYNWEKLFNYYLIDTGRYFLYPAWSYSTNFGESGVHVKRRSEENAFQVPLEMGDQLPEIQDMESSDAVYDAFFEILPSRLKRLNPKLEPYNFEVDLYGSKPFHEIEKPYVLSSKKAVQPEMTFGRNLKPHELNMVYAIEGQDFFLAKKENFRESKFEQWRRELRSYYYHYPDVSLKKVLKMKGLEVLSRIFPSLIR